MKGIGFFLVAMFFLYPAGAQAARWHQYSSDPWFWIDLDSIGPSGNLTAYRLAHSAERGVPPDVGGSLVEGGTWSAVDCVTGQEYSPDSSGSWTESGFHDDDNFLGLGYGAWIPDSMDRSSTLYALLCNR